MRPLHRSALVLLLLLGLTSATADEEPRKPARPLTPEQAADAVLEAVKAKDNDALKALAEKDEPDPWFVADVLCSRGKHDAATMAKTRFALAKVLWEQRNRDEARSLAAQAQTDYASSTKHEKQRAEVASWIAARG